MSTIDSKHLIVQLLNNDGCAIDDPQCAAIFSYVTQEGNLTQAVYWPSQYLQHEVMNLYNFCRDVKLLWSKSNGLTNAGKEWLNKYADNEHLHRNTE